MPERQKPMVRKKLCPESRALLTAAERKVGHHQNAFVNFHHMFQGNLQGR